MRGVALACALLVAGCGGNSYVQFSSSGSPATGVSSGGSVYAQGSSTEAAVFALIMLLGASYLSEQSYEGYGTPYRSMPYVPPPSYRPVPALDPARSVNEQDCSRPIENWSANLRCK